MPEKTLHFANPKLLSQLYCDKPSNLTRIEDALDVSLTLREDWVKIEGNDKGIEKTETLFELLNLSRTQGLDIKNSDFNHILRSVASDSIEDIREIYNDPVTLKFKQCSIIPKTINQKRYLKFIHTNDIVFGIGPAGTGKTFLAVAAAAKAFLENKVDKIILTRPAVEAGEALGFLPGDLQEKILPYLRPLYDALYYILGPEEVTKLMEKNALEIAPLAYMRGRTLSNAFIILDEAQNTTPEQMMMFLTRLGDSSQMIITGDITQVDLPKSKASGLKQAIHILSKIQDIKFFFFESKDVVRHPLVQNIIDAYEHSLSESK